MPEQKAGSVAVTNQMGREDSRYPQVTEDELQQAQLDIILLSSEPFPYNREHRQAITDAFPDVTIYLVDGEMFSWYGSRLLLAVPYLQRVISKMAQGALARQGSNPIH